MARFEDLSLLKQRLGNQRCLLVEVQEYKNKKAARTAAISFRRGKFRGRGRGRSGMYIATPGIRTQYLSFRHPNV